MRDCGCDGMMLILLLIILLFFFGDFGFGPGPC